MTPTATTDRWLDDETFVKVYGDNTLRSEEMEEGEMLAPPMDVLNADDLVALEEADDVLTENVAYDYWRGE